MTRARGFTLIEIVIFIVVVSIALLSVTLLFTQSVRHSSEPLLRQKAVVLASAYMDEILRKRWHELSPAGGGCVETGSSVCADYCNALTPPACGVCKLGGSPAGSACEPWATAIGILPTPGKERPEFDTVDDYADLPDTLPRDAEGELLAGYVGYQVDVEVASPATDWHGIPGADVKRITVTVRPPRGAPVTLTGYRVNY